MKNLLAFLFLIACVGCGRSGPVDNHSGAAEFLVEVLITADDSGGPKLDAEGQYTAECRLKNRVLQGGDVTTPILETISIKGYGARKEHCLFEYSLPFMFCAMTSVQDNMTCEVAKSRDSGWFVAAHYRNPQTQQLLCRIACFGFLERQ